MIGIKVNGRFLDIKPGATAEIERKSPFFAMEAYASEATLDTINIRYTPNNALALDLPFQFYTERRKKLYPDAEYWSDDRFISKCTLIIETGQLNINNIEATEITGYLLYGVSSFFSQIKDKKLTDLRLGGLRTFTFTSADPNDASGGFWQHIHDTWTDFTIPYVFFPVRNETYNGEGGNVEWNNGLDNDGKIKHDFANNPIVPWIRLPYLLTQIFIEAGWKVDFTGINDTDWEKLTLESLKEIVYYVTLPFTDPITGDNSYIYLDAYDVKFKLNEYLPPEKKISDFLVQLFFRLGIAPLFNTNTKTVFFIAVKELRNGPVLDWTTFCNPNISTDFKDEVKVYALSNEIDSNDAFPQEANLTTGKLSATPAHDIFSASHAFSNDGLIQYTFRDNKYWQVTQDSTNPLIFDWVPIGDNIFKDEPKATTDTITSTISTLPVYFSEYREISGGIKRYAFFPIIKQEKTQPFGYRLLFYKGLDWECDESGNAGPPLSNVVEIPIATSLCVNTNGEIISDWSLPYSHQQNQGGSTQVDYGSRPYWWDDFLNILRYGETQQTTFYLSLQELSKYSWEKKIMIANVQYLMTQYIEPVPFTGFIQATIKRIVRVADQIAASNNGGGGLGEKPHIYVHMEVENIRLDPTGAGTAPYNYYNASTYESCDVVIRLYEDAAGTIPYTPPVGLDYQIRIKSDTTQSGTIIATATNTYTVTEQETIVLPRNFHYGEVYGTSPPGWLAVQNLEVDPLGYYTVI